MATITSTFDVAGGQMHCRHNELVASRETLLFIHGLGESGLCFVEALNQPLLSDYNVIIPDLVGFGYSTSNSEDYSFRSQIDRLATLLDTARIDRVHVIGHSMGGDLGTLFCGEYPSRALSLVNIEGNLTPEDRFITSQAISAERDGRFEEWFFADFAGGVVVNWAFQWPSCVRYIASLHLCRPAAFLASAKQVYELNSPDSTDSRAGIIGIKYKRLALPRVFCLGTGQSATSRKFLVENDLLHQSFPDAFHWVMLDTPKAFYEYLAGFLAHRNGR